MVVGPFYFLVYDSLGKRLPDGDDTVGLQED